MEKKAKNILRYLFWAAVAVALLYFCFSRVDWEQFLAALAQCRWGYIALAFVLGVLMQLLRGLRWRMLLLPLDPDTRGITACNAYNIGMAVNLALPRAGELVRMGYAVNHSAIGADGQRRAGFDKALGTVVTERLIDVLVMLLLTGLALALKWEWFAPYLGSGLHGDKLRTMVLILLALLVLAGAGLYLAWRFRERGTARVWQFLQGIWNGVASIAHMRRGWLFVLHTLLIWGLHVLTSACIIWALQDMPLFAGMTLADAFLIMLAGSLSTVIPAPGGFGAYHTVVTAALSGIWGIPAAMGLVFATLNHETQVLVQAVCGLVSYVHESFFRKA